MNQSETEQMLAHISTDLQSQFIDINSCALSMCGALFDQTQLLRPGYPIYASLEARQQTKRAVEIHEPILIAIGAQAGRMPDDELQPATDIPLGLLQTLPIICSGDQEIISEMSDSMEHRFLESGQLCAHSAKAMEVNFGIAINHARFMTVTDLNAMLHLQLDHFGFLPLWQLLDNAINSPGESLSVNGLGGQKFEWTGTCVQCCFETFDFWATHGQGKGLASDGQFLAKAYSEWTREYRQYLTTLVAHEIPVRQVSAHDPSQSIDESFLVEKSTYQSRQDAVQITEHSSGELGTIAVSVTDASGMLNYYPMIPSGLNDLHASIRENFGVSGAVSFPGSVLYDERSRQLRPDLTQK